jgi:DNA-binding winged helix-turn-helix (wHTH) protein
MDTGLGEVPKMIGRKAEIHFRAPRYGGPVTRFGPFSFVAGDGLWRGGQPVALPPRAMAILSALLATPGTVVTKQALMDAAWPGTFVTESSLLEAVGLLRQTLGDDARRPTYIQTVHRRGYRFIQPIETVGPPAELPFLQWPEWRPIVAACVTYAITTVCVAIVFALFGPRVERRIELATSQALFIPSWTSGGLDLAFALSKAGPLTLMGTGHQLPTSVSRDGSLLVFTEFHPLTGADVWLLDRRTGTRHALVRTPAHETWARLSPDGRQIAYMSNESGRWEIYVRPTAGAGAARRVSANGGAWPSWSDDGRIYFSERIHGRPELRVVLDWFSELASHPVARPL